MKPFRIRFHERFRETIRFLSMFWQLKQRIQEIKLGAETEI